MIHNQVSKQSHRWSSWQNPGQRKPSAIQNQLESADLIVIGCLFLSFIYGIFCSYTDESESIGTTRHFPIALYTN